jgi:DNA replication protein DnaC
MTFAGLPPEQQRVQLLEVVPERYVVAEIEHLSVKLQELFAAEIDSGVLLWGSTGAGKTYAMAALAKRYVTEGFRVRRVHYEMLCLQIRDTYNPKATQTEWGIIEPLLNCDKLFIEDVGVSRRMGKQETDHSTRTLQVLIDIRLERLRATFITSNKSVENLAKSFDERVGDRLRLFHVRQMTAESKRKK